MSGRTTKVQIELSDKRLQEIDLLMEQTDTATRKEFFNNALTLLKWAIDKAKHGYTIASVKEDEKRFRELEMPILANAATKAKEK